MILDRFSLDRKVALVTGGTKGIGRAIAVALAEAGSDVAVVSRSPDADLKNHIEGLGRKYAHYRADLTRRQETKTVVPAHLERMGELHILVNNAGVIHRSPAVDYPERDWDDTLEVDLSAAFILSQAAGRTMIERGGGKIINVASVLSFQGGVNVMAYVVSKHGIVGLTRALANDWAGKGVNVNALAPGFIATDLTGALRSDPERSKFIESRTPAGRWGVPEDISGAAVFLASPASDFIHGAVLPIDGGWISW